MWILLNDSFLSIVADRDSQNNLLVRARHREDIGRLFPKALVIEGAGSDYRYRSFILARDVAKVISSEILRIEYQNFKDSVKEPWRHDCYMEIWFLLRKWFQGK